MSGHDDEDAREAKERIDEGQDCEEAGGEEEGREEGSDEEDRREGQAGCEEGRCREEEGRREEGCQAGRREEAGGEEEGREEEVSPAMRKPSRPAATLPIALLVLVCASGSTLGTAHGASLTNRDNRQHELEIRAGGPPESRLLKPGEAIRNFCPKGCSIGWSGGNEYLIEGTDEVSIEDGFMYYDSPAGGSSSSPPGVPSLRPGR